MSVNKPYKRTVRCHTDGSYSNSGRSNYVRHPNYANSPEHYVRAFLFIQDDFIKLLNYIEPSDTNLDTYSFRILELLMRVCIEVEANFKAILLENGYNKPENNLDMRDYVKVDKSHRLHSYKIKLPYWQGDQDIRSPFSNWINNQPLNWYQAYNASKHNRHNEFTRASFRNLTDAVCGLIALLSAQFYTHDFSPGNVILALNLGNNDGMESAIGGYFRVQFPSDWEDNELYDFEWETLKNEDNPFQLYDYTQIAD